MEMMMSQMMEIIKVSQGKDKETIVPETDSVGKGIGLRRIQLKLRIVIVN